MPDLHIALAELARIAPDALRGLGYSHAVSDRAARMVAWGEAVHRLSLPFLRLNQDRLRSTARHAFHVEPLRIANGPATAIDARGKCSLESGPRALDLAHADAQASGRGISVVQDTFGHFLLGELISTSLARALPTIILYRSPNSADEAGDPFEGSGFLAALPVGKALDLPDGSTPPEALGLEGREAAALAEVALQLEALSGDKPGFAVFSMVPEAGEPLAVCAGSSGPTLHPWQNVVNFAERYHDALANGMKADQGDWSALGSFVRQMRVETSERSRQQAG